VKIIIPTIGTRGDVQPYIVFAIGEQIRQENAWMLLWC